MAAIAVTAVLVTTLATGPAQAEDFRDPEDLPEASNQMVADAVRVFDVRDAVRAFTPNDSVQVVKEQVRRVDGDTLITLSSDILFEPERAELPDTAPDNLEPVLRDVPRAAEVSVTGHTDSVGDDASNQTLSEERAQAVANAIAAARPDLVLTVAGRGETEPVATEVVGDSVDVSARAKNRRVEIRYGT
ncbi:OmpA family protein [Actinotalea sp. BY-33]|uniref:OmpA family protein n=1 Tax=Actinotalea soli TaxID=2819234 RepID=A0A939LQH5_9CELL|nr:OmpA family protein [Actinotalea soli]